MTPVPDLRAGDPGGSHPAEAAPVPAGDPADWRAATRAYFAADARHYDLREPLRRRWRQAVLAASGVRPGDEVLDACTGTGAMAMTFAGAGARVTAVDLSPHMLARARAKDRAGAVRWLEADVCALPFPDRSFDLASITMALHCMPEPARRAALRELARVARRRVLVFEPAAPRWAPARWLLPRAARRWMPPYWEDFLRHDVTQLARECGLEVEADRPVDAGLYRLLVCRPAAAPEAPPAAPGTGTAGSGAGTA